MRLVTRVYRMMVRMLGSVILKKVWNELAPSISALSKSVGLMPRMPGDQHDHGVPVPEPELDEGHDIARRPFLEGKIERSVDQAQALENVVHRPFGVAEQSVEKDGDRCCRYDVGHIDQDLESTLTLYLETPVREPGSEQKCEKDLWNEVDNPDNGRIRQGEPERCGLKHCLVVQKRICQEREGRLGKAAKVREAYKRV